MHHSLIEPATLDQMRYTLTRIHNARRTKYLFWWNLGVWGVTVFAITFVLYLCRVYHLEAQEYARTSHAPDTTEYDHPELGALSSGGVSVRGNGLTSAAEFWNT